MTSQLLRDRIAQAADDLSHMPRDATRTLYLSHDARITRFKRHGDQELGTYTRTTTEAELAEDVEFTFTKMGIAG